MSQMRIIQGLPFISAKLTSNGKTIELDYVLLDTGAAAAVFKTDDLKKLGIEFQLGDEIIKMTGIGGDEYVIEKQIDSIAVGELKMTSFTIQIGAMDYGMQIDGILGADFLLKTGAKIDFEKLTINP